MVLDGYVCDMKYASILIEHKLIYALINVYHNRVNYQNNCSVIEEDSLQPIKLSNARQYIECCYFPLWQKVILLS